MSPIVVTVAPAAPFAKEKPLSPEAAERTILLKTTGDEPVAVLPPDANVADMNPRSRSMPSSLQLPSVAIPVFAPSPVQVAAVAGFGPITMNEPAFNCGTRSSGYVYVVDYAKPQFERPDRIRKIAAGRTISTAASWMNHAVRAAKRSIAA